MRIGLLITSIGNFGQKGFYNSQEIGLAKELDKLFEEVVVYKAIPDQEKKNKTAIEDCKHAILYQIPVKSRGINGIWNCNIMDSTLDALIYFSDTQLAVPKVYKWCRKNNIEMYPYIGVTESHSTHKLKKILIDLLFQRNIYVYRHCKCFVKTPTVCKKLKELKIKNRIVTPVGLDVTLLHKEYKKESRKEIKQKYGYLEENKIILFIGRLIEEKQPRKMIGIFNNIVKVDKEYKLLIVGDGELKKQIESEVVKLNLKSNVQIIERIPNNKIWELYRIADVFVNLNQQEIFGMAILEAMYYGCKVVAWKAPGPNLIIESGKSGFLVNKNEDVEKLIINGKLDENDIHNRVMEHFTWKNVAKIMKQEICRNKRN